MGLKISNYTIDEYGIVLKNAYAQITNASVGLDGRANCVFQIQQSREDVQNKEYLERKSFSCEVDKDLPLFKQLYENAKETLFPGWEDDIV